ncbi:MAG: low-specificity L-threonine aldolase [Rectinemataceae bacterium]
MAMADFRSDTVTKPSPGMRKAMYEAEVGDDVYGDDPTINRLQGLGAEMLGKEAAIFVSSGTQSNLLALLSHCQRGDEYIAGQDAHTYQFEGGGAAVFGSIQPQPIDFEPDGSLDLEKVADKIKPVDFHFAQTRLLCLENTHNGIVLSLDYQKKASAFARRFGLSLHLDGARVFNASVKQGIDVRDITHNYNTVSVCLSKGLGAPVGSLLCGPLELVTRARRWRKVLGGGMRQAGILAAAGLYALEKNVGRLSEDHDNAAYLAKRLADIDRIEVLPRSGETNMVFIRFRVDHQDAAARAAAAFLLTCGIRISERIPIRLVTHLDINRKDVDALVHGIADFCKDL